MMGNKAERLVKRVLIWSEKYTKTDMLYIGKKGFWLVFYQVSAIVIGFMLISLMLLAMPKILIDVSLTAFKKQNNSTYLASYHQQ